MISDRSDAVAAAEVALKTYVLRSTPGILADLADAEQMTEQIDRAVSLTEAPEDAVCSLVIDLMRYCGRNGIDWQNDVIGRAEQRAVQSTRKY